MTRPKCGVCEGAGQVDSLTFSTPRRLVKRTCSHCHGKGVVALKVDLYEIVEWLRSLPSDEWYPSNIAEQLEEKWGAQHKSEGKP